MGGLGGDNFSYNTNIDNHRTASALFFRVGRLAACRPYAGVELRVNPVRSYHKFDKRPVYPVNIDRAVHHAGWHKDTNRLVDDMFFSMFSGA